MAARKLKTDAANVARRKKNHLEYKKYQGSKKRIKYRAELNAYARKHNIYGKRASKGQDVLHKDGKIVGVGSASKNRAAGARGKDWAPKKKKKKD